MNQHKSVDATYGLAEKLGRIEDKLLERGTFTNILGQEFEISFAISDASADGEGSKLFNLIIKIESSGRSLSDESAEEIADWVSDFLIDLIGREIDEDARKNVTDSLRESQVFFNGKRVY
jgi:hypothetical protein